MMINARKNEHKKQSRVLTIIAKIVRILSVPPLMVTMLAVVIELGKGDVFRSWQELAVFWICLALIPVLAYPLTVLFPALKKEGREGERNTAFVTSTVGYFLGLCCALISRNPHLIFVTGTYVCSVALLLVWNKLLKIRSSGHGCSVVGPFAFGIWYFGLPAVLPCVILYALILWASLYLKRHTLREFLGGSLICLIAMGISWLLCLASGVMPA